MSTTSLDELDHEPSAQDVNEDNFGAHADTSESSTLSSLSFTASAHDLNEAHEVNRAREAWEGKTDKVDTGP